MLSKSRCDVVVHAEFQILGPDPTTLGHPYFAGRQPRGAAPDAEIPTDPSARPSSSFGHRTGIGASRSVDVFRGIAHVSL